MDELLGGYSWYLLQKVERRLAGLRRPGLEPARRALLHALAVANHAPTGVAGHLATVSDQLAGTDRFGGGQPAWFYLWSAMAARTGALLGPSVADLAPSPLPAPNGRSWLHRSLHYEQYTRLPAWVLVLSDRLSMANGIEVRVPFLDRALLDLAARTDAGTLLRGTTEKYPLKRAFADVLPARVRRRRKKPFFTPVAPWYLTGPGRDLAGTYLAADTVRSHGLFDPAQVRTLHQAALAGGGRTWDGAVAEWATMAVLTTHLLVERFGMEPWNADPEPDDVAVLAG